MYSTCQWYGFPLGTLIWKVSQILAKHKILKSVIIVRSKQNFSWFIKLSCFVSNLCVRRRAMISFCYEGVRGRPLIIWGGAWCKSEKKIRSEACRKKRTEIVQKKNSFAKIRSTPPQMINGRPLRNGEDLIHPKWAPFRGNPEAGSKLYLAQRSKEQTIK